MLKSSIKLSIIAVAILLLVALPSHFWFNDPKFHAWLNTHLPANLAGAISLFSILALLTAIGLPRQIAAFISGFIFNTYWGFVIAIFAAISGCWLTVTFANKFLIAFITKKYPEQQQALHKFLADKIFYKAIIIRILPIGSNFLTNIIAGVCNLKKSAYIAGSFIGFIPQMVIFSLAGAGVKLGSSTHLLISAILLLVALVMSYTLYKHNRITT